MNHFHLHSKKIIIIVSAVCVLALLLIAAATASALILNDDNIYTGVYVDSLNIGGLSKEEASSAITEEFIGDLETERTILLQCGDIQKELALLDLSAQLDVEQIVENAYQIGRNGNPFSRLKEIFSVRSSHVVLPPVIACDESGLESIIQEIAAQVDEPGQEMQAELIDSELVITRGVPGNSIDVAKTAAQFKETALTLKSGIFSLHTENILPKEPNAEDLYSQFCGEAANAEYKVENQRLVVTEEKIGVDFDKDAAQNIIDQTADQVIKIPVTLTQPEVTVEQINSQLFGDLLGSYSTKYNAGDVSRSHNVSLASQNINDVVLAPGDVFSYNDTVGPRTTARGFRTANVYVGNRVEPGIGGGICQVSSTLYNTVVYADLEIVSRTNHSLPVSYVPMGRDATVSYGSIDFKFANNTNHPIKIVASAVSGVNKISIYGTKENKNKTIEITTEHIATRPYTVVQKEDPSLPVGTTKVEQKGANGSTYNAYKITKENGSVVKREFLSKSTYVPSDRIELVGTMPTESPSPAPDTPASADVPDVTETPVPTPTPPDIVAPALTDTPEPTEPGVTPLP